MLSPNLGSRSFIAADMAIVLSKSVATAGHQYAPALIDGTAPIEPPDDPDYLGDTSETHRVVVAASQERLPRRRAQAKPTSSSKTTTTLLSGTDVTPYPRRGLWAVFVTWCRYISAQALPPGICRSV
jgi:hypothetical protein